MKAAKKQYRPADIYGESSHFIYRLTMTIQSSLEGAGKYTIECERYSTDDGNLLDKNLIVNDHHNKAFQSLNQVKKFVKEDAIEFWQEKMALANTDREIWDAYQKLTAWRMFYDKLTNFINENGDPINKQSSIN